MADTDDGSIADGACLLRRINPDQIVDDPNSGGKRPSSAAFKDPEMSVDAEPILIDHGLDWRFSLKDHPGYSLVNLKASYPRQEALAVIAKPLVPENPAHTEIHGKKTQGIAKRLASAAAWVHLESPK